MSKPVHRTASGATLTSYVVGFVLSIALTLLAYFLVTHHVFATPLLALVIAWLALAQFVVQALCFLHVANGPRPRWNVLVFGSMILVVFILVFGSLWIMTNLTYGHGQVMSPGQTDRAILKDENIKR